MSHHPHERHCPYFVRAVEILGDEAGAGDSVLRVVAVKGDKYVIEEYDGLERVETPESIRWVTATMPDPMPFPC